MYYSLTQRLGALPDDTVLFPGHNYGGASSTIGDEKRQNPFMRFASLGDFLRAMGGGRRRPSPALISGHDFAARLERHGFDFFTGVPCSLIEDLIAVLERGTRAPYVAAVREDAAVGVAAGAWFGGRRPVVLMQNSGLGTSLNALASLSLMYGLPALLIVTWRGFGGKDAPEHILTGEISPRLLELLGVPHRVLAIDSLDADLAWAAIEMDARRCARRAPGAAEGRGDRGRPRWHRRSAARRRPSGAARARPRGRCRRRRCRG